MPFDVGSGILSFLSAQAGAKRVVALEASSMAEKISIVRQAMIVMSVNELITRPAGQFVESRQSQSFLQRPDTGREGLGRG